MPRQTSLSPEEHARRLRTRLKILTVPVPVERIARALGAEIRLSPLDDELSGMIYLKASVPMIGVNALHHPNRQRFTIAHEIGHLEMHRHLIENKVHVDKAFQVLRRDATSGAGTDTIEIAANQFAAELLIPENILTAMIGNRIIDIDDERPIEELARRFKVSKKAMEYRIQRVANRG
jgi:Zn-dependent peptidase ImmA (M78 family)